MIKLTVWHMFLADCGIECAYNNKITSALGVDIFVIVKLAILIMLRGAKKLRVFLPLGFSDSSHIYIKVGVPKG